MEKQVRCWHVDRGSKVLRRKEPRKPRSIQPLVPPSDHAGEHLALRLPPRSSSPSSPTSPSFPLVQSLRLRFRYPPIPSMPSTCLHHLPICWHVSMFVLNFSQTAATRTSSGSGRDTSVTFCKQTPTIKSSYSVFRVALAKYNHRWLINGLMCLGIRLDEDRRVLLRFPGGFADGDAGVAKEGSRSWTWSTEISHGLRRLRPHQHPHRDLDRR